MSFSLEVFAVHELKIGGGPRVVPHGAAPRTALGAGAIDRIERYIADMDARDEALGKAVSIWWDTQRPAEFGALVTCSVADFDRVSRDAMSRLSGVTPATAASGVVVFVRGTRSGGAAALAMFKMAPHAVSFTQFDPTANPSGAITLTQLANVLPEPKEVAKAAIMPNPVTAAPLRVVDVLTREGPADYWLRFLGAQQLLPQPRLSRMLADAGQSSLVAEGVAADRARSLVGQQLAAAALVGEPIEPRTFLDGIAGLANRPAPDVWRNAMASHPELARPHVQVSLVAAARLKTTIDLGDDVMLTGPAAAMTPPRVEIAQDEGGWFAKVRTTAEPVPRTT